MLSMLYKEPVNNPKNSNAGMDIGLKTWLKILPKGFRARKIDNH